MTAARSDGGYSRGAMFESVTRQYKPRLSWWLGVLVFSLAPLALLTGLVDLAQVFFLAAPALEAFDGALLRVEMGLLIVPVFLPLLAAERLGLGLRSAELFFLGQQILLGFLATLAVRRFQSRRFRRVSRSP